MFYWENYARHYEAMMLVLEHRFYGHSWPSGEHTLEVLQLLTSKQALADAATFIDKFTEMRSLNGSKWVALGGSYSGNLAAWMKQKYPNHVKAAVASSSPLLALFDFPGYMETISDVVKEIDRDCYDEVYDAFSCMESLVNGSTCENYKQASQIPPALLQCRSVDFDNTLSRESFFRMIAMPEWGGNWPSKLVRRNCERLKQTTGSDIIKTYGNFLMESGALGVCTLDPNYYPRPGQMTDEDVFNFIHSDEGKVSGAAGWLWQTCFEFGYFMSSDPKNGLFGYNTWSGLRDGTLCERKYGEKFSTEFIKERIALTNDYYKGKDIDSKCVIFVNGGWDPWHTLGINRESETSPDNTVVHIPGSEHCGDMYEPSSDEVAIAQQIIKKQIGLYLEDPKC